VIDRLIKFGALYFFRAFLQQLVTQL